MISVDSKGLISGEVGAHDLTSDLWIQAERSYESQFDTRGYQIGDQIGDQNFRLCCAMLSEIKVGINILTRSHFAWESNHPQVGPHVGHQIFARGMLLGFCNSDFEILL